MICATSIPGSLWTHFSNKQLTFVGLLTTVPLRIGRMTRRSMEELEAGVERLLEAYGRVKDENLRLKEQVAVMTNRQDLLKKRLDTLLSRLEGVDSQ